MVRRTPARFFLLIALIGGCIKLVASRGTPPWEFVFLLLGVALVLAVERRARSGIGVLRILRRRRRDNDEKLKDSA